MLGTLSSLLFSRDAALRVDSPIVFQTLLQGIFSLYPLLSQDPSNLGVLQALASEIINGGVGVLSQEAVEQEFGGASPSKDEERQVRIALTVESVARCVANGSGPSRGWILRNLMEVRTRLTIHYQHL